jgi:AcrR family transcriptional regulator
MGDGEATSGGKRVRRSRTDVVDAALRVLNYQGLPDLTMRNVAAVLGVQPSALYWHFPSKQALLANVSSQILSPMNAVLAGHQPLPQAVITAGERLRECLLRHRDGAEVVSSSLALGLIEPPLHATLTDAARTSGFPTAVVATAEEAATHFVIGFVFHEQQRNQADTLGVLAAPTRITPEHAAAADNHVTQQFRAVLELIASGTRASLPPEATRDRRASNARSV